MDKIKVLIVDDHQMSAFGVQAMLAHDQAINVAGIVFSGQEALNFLKKNIVDVVLLDVIMPEMDGCETLRRIKTEYPRVKVIMLTISDEKQTIIKALAFKANGFIFKDILKEEMAIAIKRVKDNKWTFSERIFEIILNEIMEYAEKEYAKMSNDNPKLHKPARVLSLAEIQSRLTKREFEMFCLVGKGYKTAEIAEEIKISKFTINSYRKNLYTKLNIHEQRELVKLAKMRMSQ